MGISARRLRTSLDRLAGIEPAFADHLERVGYPPPRIRDRGYTTLLRTIIGQQVSVKAAESIWNKVADTLNDIEDPAEMAATSEETLRGAGLSRQKVGYARSLAELTVSGALDFETMPKDDEEAIALLTAVKGIGRWSAEIYLLFAEGRGDIWPAGDLAVQIAIGEILGWPERPSEKQIREVAENWRPHRGAAAIFAWHVYNTKVI
jgi:DNA-3-methyladenine glycosylase II